MKRSEIQTGAEYAASTGKYKPTYRVKVLDGTEWVDNTPAYYVRNREASTITLADGSTVTAFARRPATYDVTAQKGVLVQTLEVLGFNADSDAVGRIWVAALRDIKGPWAPYQAAQQAARDNAARAQQAQREREARVEQERLALQDRLRTALDNPHIGLGFRTARRTYDVDESLLVALLDEIDGLRAARH